MDSGAAARLDTLRDLLRYAVTCFERAQLAYGHGSQNAYDEAAYLLLRILHLPLDRLEPRTPAAGRGRRSAAGRAARHAASAGRHITREASGDFYIDERAISHARI